MTNTDTGPARDAVADTGIVSLAKHRAAGRCGRRKGESGFALVLAILSLMLLTFLGLTLATTTSTELQIATNYRWSQQALYNAEAGLEAARIILAEAADADEWLTVLPARRVVAPWFEGAAPGPVETATGRDFEMVGCDLRGGIGYGLVLNDGTTRYESVSTFQGETLNGAFTIWIRRPLDVNDQGQFSDSLDDDLLVIVSEGVAPYQGPSTAVTRARQAVRLLETRYSLGVEPPNPCLGALGGQEGMSPTGENFNPCAPVTDGTGGSLENVFGGGGAGALTGTGVE
jgi:hypothetical protein